MAGKYHRTYFAEDVQAAFEKMQKEKGVASNAFVLACVKARLEAEGYLPKKKKLNVKGLEHLLPSEPEVVGGTNEISSSGTRTRRGRRRRA